MIAVADRLYYHTRCARDHIRQAVRALGDAHNAANELGDPLPTSYVADAVREATRALARIQDTLAEIVTWEVARHVCRHCGESIGWDVRFCLDHDGPDADGLAHELCVPSSQPVYYNRPRQVVRTFSEILSINAEIGACLDTLQKRGEGRL